MKIIWLPLAEDNLDHIYDYYAQYSMESALNIVNTILHSVTLLKNHPAVGAVVPDLKEYSYTFRSLVTYKGRYKIIYYHTENVIYIYAVWDCRKNPENVPIK